VLTIASTAELGNGGVALDDGKLVTTGDLNAGTRAFQVGIGGGTLEVADNTTLTTVPFTGSGNPLLKHGPGTWRIQGGNSASTGMLTVAAGVLDLNRNDTWGNHSTSTQSLTIQSGGLVTNGTSVTSGFNTVQTLALAGGELRVTGTARALVDGDLFRFEAYGIRHSITVTGTAASSITNPDAIPNAGINIGDVINLGDGAGADLTIEVADVTGSDEGDGTLELTAVNRYTGNTSVETGTLILAQAFLADTADVKLASGATLQLDFAGTDTIDELLIDGLPQAAGTWGRSGHPTAEHTTSLITGDGLLEVTTGPAEGYAGWASGFLPAFTNTAADLDFENDGLASGIEWVVGGDPTLNDAASVAPAFDNTTDPDDFLFTFRRRDDAAADPNTTIVVEYGSDLAGWTPALDGVGGVSINDTTDLGGGFHQVTVAIPRALALGGKIFARLRVTVVTP
jgi:autotransporter-associated beta strand protein